MYNETEFFKYLQEIDLAIASPPQPEKVKRVVELSATQQLARYIFTNLKRADWLQELERSKVFETVPEPSKNLGDMYWYPIDYLIEVAKEKPDAVFEILKKHLSSNNAYVRTGILQAALFFKDPAIKTVVQAIRDWMKAGSVDRFPSTKDASVKLLNELVKRGLKTEVLSAVESLLSVRSRPSLQVGEYTMKDVVSVLDSWEYKNLLEKDVKPVFEAYPFEFLDLILSTLANAVASRTHGEPPEDYSKIWCKEIERVSKSSGHDVEETLVAAARDYGKELLESNPSRAEEVFAAFERHNWYIFKRLHIYLLSAIYKARPDLVREVLQRIELMDDYHLHKEYLRLLKHSQREIGKDLLDSVLAFIAKGPDDLFEDPANPTEEEKLRAPIRTAYWTSYKLSALDQVLPDEWTKKLPAIKKVIEDHEVDHPRHPEGVWHGPTSSKTPEDLNGLDDAALLEVLKSEPKTPKARWISTPEGLARSLGAAIRQNPNRTVFLSRADELDLVYIEGIFAGLREGVKAIKAETWPVILSLVEALKKGAPIEATSDEESDGRDGTHIKRTIAWFLNGAIEAKITPLYVELEARTWSVIEWLLGDADPTSEYEQKHLKSMTEAYQMAINSARGEGLNCAIQFALKRHGHFKKATAGQTPDARFRNVLNRHIDIALEPSLAVRSVYGTFLPWIILIDPEWAAQNLARLFPEEDEKKNHSRSVWYAYLLHNPAYDDAFKVLESQYLKAVNDLPSMSEDTKNVGDRLVEHLMVLYWRKRTQLSAGVLKRFYEIAPLGLRKKAINFVGHALKNNEGAMSSAVKDLVCSLYDARSEAALRSKETEELSPFGWWFTCQQLPQPWRLATLKKLLENDVEIEPDFDVIEELQKMIAYNPTDALFCLDRLVDQDDRTRLYSDREAIKGILKYYLEDPSQAASRSKAVELVNKMGSKGFLDFKELI